MFEEIVLKWAPIVISSVSLSIALRSARAAERSAKLAEKIHNFSREQQIECFSSRVESAINQKLPTGNVNNAAGLVVARILDELPSGMEPYSKQIVEAGFYRAVPAGNFDSFWKHLCEIQRGL